MQKNILAAVVAVLCSSAAEAENLVPENKVVEMNVSIYQNTALVKDSREVQFVEGMNEIAFEGVSSKIRPETAVFSAEGIKIFEQNYDYDLINAQNLLDESVGKKVKTAEINPQTGETIIKEALLVNSSYGTPILKFDYGIEAGFPGRVVFEKIPENLRVKPTLMAKAKSQEKGRRLLELDYLTGGLSWRADYIAEVADDEKLQLNAWVTLKNESGADYKNASVQLISGNVNQVQDIRPVYRNMMFAAKTAGIAEDSTVEAAAAPISLGGYYLYTLPEKTDILDKQSKQVSLFAKDDVAYEKKYTLISPLFLGQGARGEFENKNPAMTYKLTNLPEANLGVPLPGGVIRFYGHDDKGGMQFLGESRINPTAVGGKAELEVGQAFDLTVSGRVLSVKEISDKVSESRVEILFTNAGGKEAVVEFLQNIPNKGEILQESQVHEVKSASRVVWKVAVSAGGEAKLTYTARVTER